MGEMTVKLNKTDRKILESYKNVCEGLSDYLGDGYELVLYSLESFEHSAIKVINGYHTGCVEGDPLSEQTVSILTRIQEMRGPGYMSYLSKDKRGEPLKSSTIAVKGEGSKIIGLLCINFYMNTPLSHLLELFLPAQAAAGKEQPQHIEQLVDNVDDMIFQTVKEVLAQVREDHRIIAANKNKEVIGRLYLRGIFNLKDAVIKVADQLGISKNTVYMHVRNLNKEIQNTD